MDRQMILDYLVQETQDKAAKHYRQKHFRMPGLYQALWRINDQRECIIRPMPTSDSGACRPPVPTDVGHLFRWHVVQ